MSAENTVEEKSRRRRRRSSAETENEAVEEDEMEEAESAARGITASKGRATPGRRNQLAVDEVQRGNALTRPFYDLREYFLGVRDELRKVSWPTREEMRRLAIIVIVVTILSSIVLGIISIVFTELFVIGLETPLVFGVVFGAGALGFLAFNRLRSRAPGSY